MKKTELVCQIIEASKDFKNGNITYDLQGITITITCEKGNIFDTETLIIGTRPFGLSMIRQNTITSKIEIILTVL